MCSTRALSVPQQAARHADRLLPVLCPCCAVQVSRVARMMVSQMGFSKKLGQVGLSFPCQGVELVGLVRSCRCGGAEPGAGGLWPPARRGRASTLCPSHQPRPTGCCSLSPPYAPPTSPPQVAWSSQGGNSFLGAQMAQPADCSGLTQDAIDAEVKVRCAVGCCAAPC